MGSSLLLGHSNAPIFSRLYISKKPLPSYKKPLILLLLVVMPKYEGKVPIIEGEVEKETETVTEPDADKW